MTAQEFGQIHNSIQSTVRTHQASTANTTVGGALSTALQQSHTLLSFLQHPLATSDFVIIASKNLASQLENVAMEASKNPGQALLESQANVHTEALRRKMPE